MTPKILLRRSVSSLATAVVLLGHTTPALAHDPDDPIEDPPYYVCVTADEPVGRECIVIG